MFVNQTQAEPLFGALRQTKDPAATIAPTSAATINDTFASLDQGLQEVDNALNKADQARATSDG